MQKYVLNITKLSINSWKSIVSLIVFTIIWNRISLLIVISLIDLVVELSLII
jgi:hypothetical protein